MKVEEQQAHTPKKSILRQLVKTIAWLGAIVVFLILSLLGLLFAYEDEVKAAVIAELNTHLKTEVRIAPKDIDVTIIKSFPDCSVEFSNVLMLEALPVKRKDTLLFAGRINLHFNIKDLWNKHYQIHKIKVKDAVVKLRVLKSGQVNYIFWETKEQETPARKKSDLQFDLSLLSLDHCRLRYDDRKDLFKTEIGIQHLDLKGNFNQSDFELQSSGQLLVHELEQNGHVFLKEKDCDFSVDLDVHGPTYTISKASINLNKLLLELKGGFIYDKTLGKLAISYAAPQLDIVALLSLLPAHYKTTFKDYESAGNFYATGQFNYRAQQDFDLDTDFGIKNGTITYKPNGMTAKQVQLDGSLRYSNSHSVLSLRNFGLRLNDDVLAGSCAITNFSDPYLDLVLQAGLHLENLKAFLPLDTLDRLKGEIKIATKLKGTWRDVEKQTFSDKVSIELDAQVSGLEARFKGDEQLFAIESCSVTAANREIEVKDLKLKRGSSDILLNGRLPGFFNYLADNKNPLIITGNLFSNNLRLEDFMVKYRASGGEGPLIPANVRFNLNAAILKFGYAKFEASSITGEIDVRDQKAIVSDMKLQTVDGEATIDAFADNSHNKLEVVLQSKLKNINISSLFAQFNNFGQATLQDKNIKGFASADLDFSGSWSNRLEPDLGSLRAACNLVVERGELLDFKPLLSLSRFVEIKDLQRIKFSTLQSNIRIADQTISFPKTVIENSALNISLWGSHRFDNSIDYHIQLLISELLAKKRKKADDEFGPVENDRENTRSAFILMTGTVDKPIIKYDRKGLKEKVKTDIKEEKQNIRQLLKEEFGLFKKDTASKKSKTPPPAFELEKPGNNPPKKTLEPKKKEDDDDF